MIEHLTRLPYVGYWLPFLAALLVFVPFLWFVRPARKVRPAPTAGSDAPPELATPSYAPEQRRSFRRGGNPIGLLYKHPGQKGGPLQASIVDRSIGGMGLLIPEAFEAGAVLAIRPTNADDIVPWVDVEVCVCRPSTDRCFEVGCRFVKTPPYSIMLLFG